MHKNTQKTLIYTIQRYRFATKPLASIIKVGKRWRAQLRREGYTDRTETFSTKALAEAWAGGVEGDVESLRAGVMPVGKAHTELPCVHVRSRLH